jgi:hypothetical protein
VSGLDDSENDQTLRFVIVPTLRLLPKGASALNLAAWTGIGATMLPVLKPLVFV